MAAAATTGGSAGAGPWRLALARLRRDRGGIAFLAVLATLVVLCLAAPLYSSAVAGTGPLENHLADTVELDGQETFVVALDGRPIGPTWRSSYLLGADANGRDVAVRVLYAGRNSLLIAVAAAVLALLLGTALGTVAGYVGGRIDALVMRALDVVWAFPVLLLGVALGTALAVDDATLGPLSAASTEKLATVLLIGIGTSPYVARPVRSQVRVLRGQPFVDAAIVGGIGTRRVMTREIVPNLTFGLVALLTVLIANAIVLEAALSFLGAGVRPPEPSLGSMLHDGSARFGTSPHLIVVPCAALAAIVMCVSLAGDAARRALDPHGTTGAERRP
ncbi:MAG TPA: ABC transporter permease [Solirubrobacteraceae bacterium]